MPDEPETEDEVSNDESVDDDDELEDEDDDSDDDDDEASEEDDSEDAEDGDEGDDAEDSPASEEQPRATGADLLRMLASDPEAQKILTSGLEQLSIQRQQREAQEAEAAEIQELISKGDYAEVGKRFVERHAREQARAEVADAVLKETFGPVYQDLYSQPEFKDLTAEEKLELQPSKFASDAHYVRRLEQFVQEKRFNARVEAEVQRRLKEEREASGNREKAKRVKEPSLSSGPGGQASESYQRRSTDDLLRRGFRATFEPNSLEDDE